MLGTGVRVRTKPTVEKSSVIVGILPTDVVIEVTNVRNDWKQIQAHSLISAWVPNRHVRFTKTTDTQWEKDWEEMTEEVFEVLFKNSAIKRTKHKGLQRNIKFLSS